jgi:uncharacterized protein (TIGR00288 family)
MDRLNIAVFIDVENLTQWLKHKGLEKLMAELSQSGQVVIRKAYGNWSNQGIQRFQEELNRQGFEMMHSYHPVSGKNSSDIQFTIDVMECAIESLEVDCFVLATGDSDFSPLFRRLRAKNYEVIGVGPRSPLSESVKSSCTKYIFTSDESFLPPETLKSEHRSPVIEDDIGLEPPSENLEVITEYRKALKKSKWCFVDKLTLDLTHQQLSLFPALPKGEIPLFVVEASGHSLSEDEAKSAVQLFFKAQLFVSEGKSSSDKNLFKLNKQRHYLQGIDTALVSRIMTYCNNQNKKPDMTAIKQLMYGHYLPSTFKEIIAMAKSRTTS